MSGKGQQLLILPRAKACTDDTAFTGRAQMSLKETEIQQTFRIVMDILLHPNLRDAGQMCISAYMCNYIRALVIDAHRTLVQVLIEYLEVDGPSQRGKSGMTINHSWFAYVSGIDK